MGVAIEHIKGSLTNVRRQWTRLLSNEGAAIGFARDAAVGLILGVGPMVRQQLIEGWVRVNFIPPAKIGGDWIITALHGDGASSAMATYESLYRLAAKELAVSQRVDELIDSQSLLMELWSNFPPSQQGSLRAMGFAPELLVKNDPALN